MLFRSLITQDMKDLKDRIDREEVLVSTEEELNQKVEIRAAEQGVSGDQVREDKELETRAYYNWIRNGFFGLNDEERQIMARHSRPDPRQERSARPQAAQSVGTTTAGGFTVPDAPMANIVEAMLAFGGMRPVSTVITTAGGADLPIPTDDDTAQTGEIIAENAPHNEQDVTFGQVVLQSLLYSSKIIRVSRQLMQDSSIDIGAYLNRKLATRLGRITNTHYTTGDGSSKPRGVVTASTLGKTGATGQTTSVKYVDLVDLMVAVDPAYQMNARWMTNQKNFGEVIKLTDDQNNPIFVPAIAAMAPDRILGKPVAINQQVADMAANAKSIL